VVVVRAAAAFDSFDSRSNRAAFAFAMDFAYGLLTIILTLLLVANGEWCSYCNRLVSWQGWLFFWSILPLRKW
jgi:hypothetical protein